MRLLFVLGRYQPSPSANGMCVLRIQKELLQLGIKSDIIAEGSENSVANNEFGTVFTIRTESLYKKSYSMAEKIIRALHYPIYEPQEIKIRFDKIKEITSLNSYSAIIAVLLPLNGAIAASCFSNFLIYELDSIANNEIYCRGAFQFLHFQVTRIERKLYKRASHIFHMLSHKAFYSNLKYDVFRSKSEFLDIPQLVDENIPNLPHEPNVIRILYSGMLYKTFRSPVYFLELLKKCADSKENRIEVHFYSRGDFEDLIKECQDYENTKVCSHGYVPIPDLNMAVSKCDFMLSIGNCFSGTVTSLPSKVISYMAYGKPIIHIDGGPNDSAKLYLQQYPYCLIIDPNADIEDNAFKMKAFMRDNLGKRVPFDDVQQCFQLNTPKYTAQQIVNAVQKECEGIVRQIYNK